MSIAALFRIQFIAALSLAELFSITAFPIVAQPIPAGEVSVLGAEILIDGPINQDIADEFIQKIRANPSLKNVSLNSPGGSVFPALAIARVIKTAKLNTTVPIASECHSACSLIFLAGRERIADGLLGVHQISGVNDPSLTQFAIGKIYEDLVKFNTPSYLISRMLRTPSEDMYVFAPEELELYSINIRDFGKQASTIPHLLAIETWTQQDWLIGVFMNTHINMPFVALESREMSPLLRIVHYPHRSQTFIEIVIADKRVSGIQSQLELRFEHGNDQPFSLYVSAGIEQNSYSFDLPRNPEQADLFWAAFTSGTQLTVLNGYGVEIGRFSLMGSRLAFKNFVSVINR